MVLCPHRKNRGIMTIQTVILYFLLLSAVFFTFAYVLSALNLTKISAISVVDAVIEIHRAIVSTGECPGNSKTIIVYIPETVSIKFSNNAIIISGYKIDEKFLRNEFNYVDPVHVFDYEISTSTDTTIIRYYKNGKAVRFEGLKNLKPGSNRIAFIFKEFSKIYIILKE